jgi:hypothetical protein
VLISALPGRICGRAWVTEPVPFGIVLLVLVVAAVIPATSGFLHDSRAEIGSGRLLYELGVSIVLLTAIPEEFAFRGVLLGSAMRLWGPWRASLITSALFGLWHIEPTLHTMRDNHAVAGAAASAGGQVLVVLGAVAVTFIAGLVFCWLRLRSIGHSERVGGTTVMTGLTQADIMQMRDQVFFEGAERRRRLSRFWILLLLSAMIATAGVVSDSHGHGDRGHDHRAADDPDLGGGAGCRADRPGQPGPVPAAARRGGRRGGRG